MGPEIQRGSTSELSAVAQDYLKAIWSAAEWGAPGATIRTLANRFHVTTASASDMIRRLTAEGLVLHEPYGPITLTEVGDHHARQMVRRHRLIEAFLATTLGYSPTEVHAEAEHLEHVISELMISRIDAHLGYPTTDPHGDPIPSPEGDIQHSSELVAMWTAPDGDYEVARVSDSDAERLAFVATAGILPTVRLHLRRAETEDLLYVTVAERSTFTLDEPATLGILVRPLPNHKSSDRPSRW